MPSEDFQIFPVLNAYPQNLKGVPHEEISCTYDVCLLMAQSVLPIHAVDQPQDEQYVYSNGIFIQETVDENHQIIRTYTPQKSVSAYSTHSTETAPDAEAILEAMGLEQSFIDNMRPETLSVVQNSDYITSTISYVRKDADGVTTYISEDQALEEVELINSIDQTAPLTYNPDDDRYVIVKDKYVEYEYMRIWHMVVRDAESTDGTHIFCTAGRWLKEPANQSWDSVGSVADKIAFVPDSGYGYYTADEVHTMGSAVSRLDDYLTEVSSDNYTFLTYGEWKGSGMVFEYPKDKGSLTYRSEYSDVKAYYEFAGKISYPNTVTNFNSVGTYSHSKKTISVEPSIVLGYSSLDGVYFDACVQLEPKYEHEEYGILFDISYVP